MFWEKLTEQAFVYSDIFRLYKPKFLTFLVSRKAVKSLKGTPAPPYQQELLQNVLDSTHFNCSDVSNFARQASLSITNSWGLLKLMSIQSVMPSNHLILFAPFSSCPQSFPASGSFPNKWPKYWSFNFSISPSNENSGFISFRIDWFELLAVPGTLKSLLQHHSSG